MDRGHYKTTGSFMLMDPNTGSYITETGSGEEPILKTGFIIDRIEAGQIEELKLFPAEQPAAEPEPASEPKPAARAKAPK